jgi:hypothetical protein
MKTSTIGYAGAFLTAIISGCSSPNLDSLESRAEPIKATDPAAPQAGGSNASCAAEGDFLDCIFCCKGFHAEGHELWNRIVKEAEAAEKRCLCTEPGRCAAKCRAWCSSTTHDYPEGECEECAEGPGAACAMDWDALVTQCDNNRDCKELTACNNRCFDAGGGGDDDDDRATSRERALSGAGIAAPGRRASRR